MEVMGSKKSTDVPLDTEDSPYKPNTRIPRRSVFSRCLSNERCSKLAAEIAVKHERKNHHEGINGSVAELLPFCKPVSVRLTRLPDSAVKRDVTTVTISAPVKKKKRPRRWKNGSYVKGTRRRKLDRLKRMMIKNKQSQANDKKSDTSEGLPSDLMYACTNLIGIKSDTREDSSQFSFDESAVENDRSESIKQSNVTCGWPLAREIRVSEAREYELSITIDTNDALHGPNQTNRPATSKELKTIIKSYDDLRETVITATQDRSNHNSALSPQRDYNQNNNIFLQRSQEDENRPISRHPTKRKNLSLSESRASDEQQRTSRRAKKYKCSTSVTCAESVIASEESNAITLSDNIASIRYEQDSPEKAERHSSNFLRQRSKSIETSSMNKVVVVVNRLDNSHSPLVQKWKDKAIHILNVSRPLDSPVENSNDQDKKMSRSEPMTPDYPDWREEKCSSLAMTRVEKFDGVAFDRRHSVNGAARTTAFPVPEVRSTKVRDEDSEISNVIVMRDSNEDDSAEDDDEIIGFMSSKRKAKLSFDSTSSDDEECRVRPLTRSRAKTLINEADSRVITNERTKKSRLLSDNSNSDSSCNRNEPRKNRSYCHNETRKTPLFHETRIADWINYSNAKTALNHEEIVARTCTRNQSRAAIDNSSYEITMNENEISNGQSKREVHNRVPSPIYDIQRETASDLEIRKIDDESTNSSAAHVVESAFNDADDYSRDSEFSGNDTTEIVSHGENRMARKKLTAMKDAMVVLTRLEDLRNIAESNEYAGNQIEFGNAYVFGFSTNYCDETLKDDANSNDIDLSSDSTVLSCRTADPLEIDDNSLTSESNASVSYVPSGESLGLIEDGATNHKSEKTSKRIVATVTSNDDMIHVRGDKRLSQETVESEVDVTLRLDDRLTRETVESEIDMTLRLPQETTESDVELSLILNETDKTSTDPLTMADGIPTVGNVNNDRTIRTPAADSPRDLDEHCNRCQCEEHERDDRRLNCQHISSTHKCITCNSLFKDSELLEQHRTSNSFCNSGFRCTECQTNFMTLIELAKHRVTCAEKGFRKRNSDDQPTNEEATTMKSASPETTIAESPRTKDKKPKQPNPKNQPKKNRSRTRCRVDNLTCNVCSICFETKTALSEHLYKHSSVELQEAFRIAKAKAIADSLVENAAKNNEINSKGINDDSADNQENSGRAMVFYESDKSENLIGNEAQSIQISNVTSIAATSINNVSLTSNSATVCPCHRDNDQTPVDNTDLQIEMVLLCKYCQVLFRRRECLEIHYRTSNLCANDRTRPRESRLFCANCKITLNNWADMRHHLEIHASENAERSIRFVCNICRVVFVGFGTLFCNHWVSHSKDNMFVAGRYNFPKYSVQPINGTEKLPAGASPDENYIFVAEHVCSTCKKPFSMRRDLETHLQIENCTKIPSAFAKNIGTVTKSTRDPEIVKEVNSLSFYCDVCNLTFKKKKMLSNHVRSNHVPRYVHITASTNEVTFRCTRCFDSLSSVSDLQEHSKIHSGNNEPLLSAIPNSVAVSSNAVTAEPIFVTSSVDDEQILRNRTSDASTIHTNGVTSTDRPAITDEPAVITIVEKGDTTEKARVFQTFVEIPSADCNNSGESSITSTESKVASRTNFVLPVLRGLLSDTPLSSTNYRTKTRALEDPCVNVRLSETSNTNVSASLVINEVEEREKRSTVDNTTTDSYQILLSDKSSSGDITMILSRKSQDNLSEICANPPTNQSSLEESSRRNASNESSSVTITRPNEMTLERSSVQPKEANNEGKENSYASTQSGNTQIAVSHVSSPKNQPLVPEVIEIIDEVEEREREAASTTITVLPSLQCRADSLANGTRLATRRREKKFAVGQLHKSMGSLKVDSPKKPMKISGTSRENSSGSETCSGLNDASMAADNLTNHSRASKASKMSFEEARWKWMNTAMSTSSPGVSASTRKQGFLRVKNLSELQASKSYVCAICNAAFESQRLLAEHRLGRTCGTLSKDLEYPTGISAALVLPDPSERPKTPAHTTSPLTTPGIVSSQPLVLSLSSQQPSYVSSQLVGVLTSRAATASGQLTSILGNNETMGSWLSVGNQRTSMSPLTNRTTGMTMPNDNTLMDFNNQRSSNGPPNGAVPVATTGINQFTDFTIHPQQPPVPPLSSIVVQDTTQRISESRSLGYHVLPPMVVLPPAQSANRSIVGSPRNSSSNYLPTSGGSVCISPLAYQTDRINKYSCNICHTYRCDTVEAFNAHVTKHYTGWQNSTVTHNNGQPSPVAMVSATTVAIPALSSFVTREETTRQIVASDSNSTNSVVYSSWIVKDTPQGPVLATPVTTAPTQQSSIVSYVPQNNRSVLRPATANANAPNNSGPITGQIVFRCMICKSALYKNYPPLRNHVILVHGITDFGTRCLDNIVQKSYHCTQCPSTTALFDCEEKYRQHVDTVHTHACPSCRKLFVSFLSLRYHMEHCRVNTCNDTNNTYGNGC